MVLPDGRQRRRGDSFVLLSVVLTGVTHFGEYRLYHPDGRRSYRASCCGNSNDVGSELGQSRRAASELREGQRRSWRAASLSFDTERSVGLLRRRPPLDRRRPTCMISRIEESPEASDQRTDYADAYGSVTAIVSRRTTPSTSFPHASTCSRLLADASGATPIVHFSIEIDPSRTSRPPEHDPERRPSTTRPSTSPSKQPTSKADSRTRAPARRTSS